MSSRKFYLLAFLFGCANILAAQSSGNNGIRDYIQLYQADAGALSRKYPITQSEDYFTRFGQFYGDWQKKIKSLPFSQLSQEDKVDYILLRNQVEVDAAQLEKRAKGFQSVKPLLKFDEPLMTLVRQRGKGVAFDAAKTAGIIGDVTSNVKSVQQEVEKAPPLSKGELNLAAYAVDQRQKALGEFYSFYDGYDPDFTWRLKEPCKALDSAFASYHRFLKKAKSLDEMPADGSGITGHPAGREDLIKSLASEFIPYSPEDLIAMANKEFAWCEKEMLKASAEMGFDKRWKEALEKVKNDYVAPGKQPELVQFLADEATDYVEKNNMVTVPPLAKETWRMTMLSAERQKVNPFFLGGEEIQIAYPTNTMSEPEKRMSMRGNNRHFSRAVVFHELIPGHGLQYFMMERNNPHRQQFYTPFWMEGWALYWEMILWDRQFAKTPEDRVGMLFWRMHRCARIIFSLNYHLGQWTPKQCIEFLIDKVGHEPANAEGEVRRSFSGSYGPLYQLAYMTGAKQFYALRAELVATGKMTEKEFHDAVLSNGPIPVEMIRALLTKQPLNQDFRTNWKFGY